MNKETERNKNREHNAISRRQKSKGPFLLYHLPFQNFTGNTDPTNIVINEINITTAAKKIRFHPLTFVEQACMRASVFGCPPPGKYSWNTVKIIPLKEHETHDALGTCGCGSLDLFTSRSWLILLCF